MIHHPTHTGPPAQDHPGYAPHQQRQRARLAAHRAHQVYPGPVGQLIAQELYAWDEFGFRLDLRPGGLMLRLIDHVLEAHEAMTRDRREGAA